MTFLPRHQDTPAPAPRRPAPRGVAELEQLGREALAAGRHAEAVGYFRDALRIAPLKRNLQDLMAEAMDCKSRADLAPRPRAVRAVARPRLFPEPDFTDETPTARIEAINFETRARSASASRLDPADDREMQPALLKVQRAAIAAGMPADAYGRRRKSSPRRTSFLWLAIPAVTVIAGGIGWLARMPASQTQPETGTQFDAAAAQNLEREIIDRAAKYFETNEFALAVDQLSKLTDGPEKSARLAEAYARQGAAELRRAEEHARAGETAHQLSSLGDARRSYEKALEHTPRDPAYLTEAGRINYFMGRTQQAENRKGWRENLDKAEKLFNAALEASPGLVRPLDGLARVEVARDNRSSAEQYYRRVLISAPSSPEAAAARRALESWGLKP